MKTFTREEITENSLTLLDCMLRIEKDLSIEVYRKPTHRPISFILYTPSTGTQDRNHQNPAIQGPKDSNENPREEKGTPPQDTSKI